MITNRNRNTVLCPNSKTLLLISYIYLKTIQWRLEWAPLLRPPLTQLHSPALLMVAVSRTQQQKKDVKIVVERMALSLGEQHLFCNNQCLIACMWDCRIARRRRWKIVWCSKDRFHLLSFPAPTCLHPDLWGILAMSPHNRPMLPVLSTWNIALVVQDIGKTKLGFTFWSFPKLPFSVKCQC